MAISGRKKIKRWRLDTRGREREREEERDGARLAHLGAEKKG
jgi:hypothetical protein